jgi:hypothetical protein
MKSLIRPFRLLALAALSLCQPVLADAQNYSFTMIADTDGEFLHFTGGSINDSGTVAFYAQRDDNVRGIFVGNGGPLTAIALTNGTISPIQNPAIINNRGTVVFSGCESSFCGIYTSNGAGVTNVISTDTLPGSLIASDMNNPGAILFRHSYNGGLDNRLLAISRGSIKTILDNGSFDNFSAFPNINNRGMAALKVSSSTTGLQQIVSIFKGTITVEADNQATFSDVGEGDLNDNGTVTFFGFVGGAGRGVYKSRRGVITPVAEVGGSIVRFASSSSAINNENTVIFIATLSSGEDCIMDGPNPASDIVICTDDSLNSLDIRGFAIGLRGINNDGQVLFTAFFEENGQPSGEAIFVATPTSEP